MRHLLVILLMPSFVACVTVMGERRAVGEKLVTTKCEEGPPLASLDSSRRDRVLLVLSRVDSCTDTYEVQYQTEVSQKLGKPARVALGILAGVAVAVPLIALAVAVAPKGPDVYSSGSSANAASEALGRLVAFPIGFAGVGAYEASRATMTPRGGDTVATVEREARGPHSDVVLLTGAAQMAGIGAVPLVSGTLELSFEQGLRLKPGMVRVGGIPVSLTPEVEARLSVLSLCQQAVSGFDRATLDSRPAAELQWRMKLASSCDDHGWGFADEVLQQGVTRLPAPYR